MEESMGEGFFYGLYMDPDLLKGLKYSPHNPRIAYVEDYQLDLRGVAKMIPQQGSKTWGMVIQLSQADLDQMYGSEATKSYQPETMTAILQDGQAVQTACYNLPPDQSAELNRMYGFKLLAILKKLSLPADYIWEVEGMLK